MVLEESRWQKSIKIHEECLLKLGLKRVCRIQPKRSWNVPLRNTEMFPNSKRYCKKQAEKSMRKTDAEKNVRPAVEEPGTGHPGPICSPMPGGPGAQYIRSGPVGARGVFGKWGFSSKIVCLLLDVCMFSLCLVEFVQSSRAPGSPGVWWPGPPFSDFFSNRFLIGFWMVFGSLLSSTLDDFLCFL
jgi:hypothetical protein